MNTAELILDTSTVMVSAVVCVDRPHCRCSHQIRLVRRSLGCRLLTACNVVGGDRERTFQTYLLPKRFELHVALIIALDSNYCLLSQPLYFPRCLIVEEGRRRAGISLKSTMQIPSNFDVSGAISRAGGLKPDVE